MQQHSWIRTHDLLFLVPRRFDALQKEFQKSSSAFFE
jgi:hypothetical protein